MAWACGCSALIVRTLLQVTAALPSFEEVALKLVDSGDAAALQTFLLTKLQTLGTQDKAQACRRLPIPCPSGLRDISHSKQLLAWHAILPCLLSSHSLPKKVLKSLG